MELGILVPLLLGAIILLAAGAQIVNQCSSPKYGIDGIVIGVSMVSLGTFAFSPMFLVIGMVTQVYVISYIAAGGWMLAALSFVPVAATIHHQIVGTQNMARLGEGLVARGKPDRLGALDRLQKSMDRELERLNTETPDSSMEGSFYDRAGQNSSDRRATSSF